MLFGSFFMFSNFYLVDLDNKTPVAFGNLKIYDDTSVETGLKIIPPLI